MDEEGQMWIVDRVKELIKHKGFQVLQPLLFYPGILRCLVAVSHGPTGSPGGVGGPAHAAPEGGGCGRDWRGGWLPVPGGQRACGSPSSARARLERFVLGATIRDNSFLISSTRLL